MYIANETKQLLSLVSKILSYDSEYLELVASCWSLLIHEKWSIWPQEHSSAD